MCLDTSCTLTQIMVSLFQDIHFHNEFLPSVTSGALSFFCSNSDQLWGSGRTCQRPEVRRGLHHRPERDVFLSARLPDGERELCYPHLHPQRHLERNVTHLPRYRVWRPFFFSNYDTETFWWFAEALSATNKQMLLCSCQGFLDCKRAIVSEGKHQRIRVNRDFFSHVRREWEREEIHEYLTVLLCERPLAGTLVDFPYPSITETI